MITSQNASSEEQVKNSGHAPLPLQLKGGGGGFKISEKCLPGRSEIFILVGVLIFLEGGGLSRNLEVKIKTA